MRAHARHVAALTALSTLACAAGGKQAHQEIAAPHAELAAAREDSSAVERRADERSVRVDALSAHSGQRGPPRDDAAAAAEPLVPPDRAVVKLDPAPRELSRAAQQSRPPPLPTALPIQEPGPGELASLGRARGDLSAEADAEIARARALSGLAAARALQSFAASYPRHPQADNALLEAATAYAVAGDLDNACELFARCVEEYPAGDAFPDALEELGECQARRGHDAIAREIFERILSDFPGTPAAERAGQRIIAPSGAHGDAHTAPGR